MADALGTFLKLAAFVTMATAIFYSQEYLEQRAMVGGEYYVLCLTGLLGVFVLISANSMLTVYLGIELLSLSLYALVAFDRDIGIAAEAAIKYFVLGAIASGALLYGMSMLYGMTGTLDLDTLSAIVRHGSDDGVIIGIAFIVAAVAFKFGAVPFHMWVPDVYQGAPTSVTLFIATVSNLGSFALIARLLSHGLAGLPLVWTQMVLAVAVAVAPDRQHRGDCADQSQAHAGVLGHCQCGLRAAGFLHRAGRRLPGGAQFHDRLCAHHARGLRTDFGAEPPRFRA